MTAQTDLFAAFRPAAPPPTPRPPPAEIIPAPPTIAWGRLLAQHPDIATTVLITCHDLYTGMVLESLLINVERQYWLMADHTIRELIGRGSQPGRHIFMNVKQGLAFHARHPLIWVKGGTKAGFYRLAGPGEAAPAELELPAKTLPFEVA